MQIAIDAMGSDAHPNPEIEAVIKIAQEFDDHIFLVGPDEILKSGLTKNGFDSSKVEIIHATDTITMQDKGLALALKAKRAGSRTTMAVGIDLVKAGKASAFLSAGNTGGVLATAYYRLGMLPGVERPAVTGIFPTKGGYCVVLDMGANPEVKPEHLLQFAIMGSIYSSTLLGITEPRIALLSNGEEPGKGNELVKHAYPLLEASALNFVGNVEAKEIYDGMTDVVVTDGFSGNIFLKTSEAVAKMLMETMKAELLSTTRSKIGALLAKPALMNVRRMLDPSEIGSAPFLGVNGLVFKAHGRSDARAIYNGYLTVRRAVEVNLLAELQSAIEHRQKEAIERQMVKEHA
jgi:glycerol-3-phosphate acyltransferase PlsX